MAKQPQLAEYEREPRYEHRVWGKHRKARKLLAEIADSVSTETVEDCYLLTDDPTWNAKVRDNTLKIKRLVDERKGFEQWTSGRHRSADSAPSPFDDLFVELRLDRPHRGKKYDLPKEIKNLDPDLGVRAVFVTKERVRYTVGDVRAEVTDMTIDDSGETMCTISIEGDDLRDLVTLRKQLGLRDSENVAVHTALDAEFDD